MDYQNGANPYTVYVIEQFAAPLIILKVLKKGYEEEKEKSSNKRGSNQETKNIKLGIILKEIREILEKLEPKIIKLIEHEKERKELKEVKEIIIELTKYHEWAIEEIKIENKRWKLIELEEKWN